ncbi:MAG: hypothetical protein KKB31_04335 [Nanoarchaeota archaeon]|nr:hypothetical protein [Nanoarchaeota archaeon]
MINPTRITNYGLDVPELEENILFWVLAAGKDSKIIARGLNNLLEEVGRDVSPFEALRRYQGDLSGLIKRNGIGCYTQKAKTVSGLIFSGIDLKNCGVEDLERIWGVGRKTSRCYVMHTRREARVAGLDVHILKFLKEMGVNTPSRTPGSAKEYSRLEEVFLHFVPKGMSVAEFDLFIWNIYSRNGDPSSS